MKESKKNKNLALAIPVYNNVILLKICLQSLASQTNKNFDVIIFDDCSSEDYFKVLNYFSDLNIRYIRSEINLGALGNMQYAFENLRTQYQFVMVMHEDDILHQNFVQVVESIIKETSEISFIICRFVEFKVDCHFTSLLAEPPVVIFKDKTQITNSLFFMEPYAFGSVVYNTTHYPEMKLEMDKYGEFADRPFLINGLNVNDLVACIDVPLYGYRSHEGNDTRWKLLNSEHVFSLLDFYRNTLPESISGKEFRKKSTAFVVGSVKNLEASGNIDHKAFYFFKAFGKGFISIKYFLLSNSIINKVGTIIKNVSG